MWALRPLEHPPWAVAGVLTWARVSTNHMLGCNPSYFEGLINLEAKVGRCMIQIVPCLLAPTPPPEAHALTVLTHPHLLTSSSHGLWCLHWRCGHQLTGTSPSTACLSLLSPPSSLPFLNHIVADPSALTLPTSCHLLPN
jgi:hypothetical protein